MGAVLLTAAALSLFPLSSCQSAVNVTQVHDHVYNVISPYVRPSKNFSVPTAVGVVFHLLSISSFDTAAQKLTSTGWMEVIWKNEYLVWDPAAFGGVSTIFPDPGQLWRPRLTIRNTMKDLKAIGEDYIVMQAGSDGTVCWLPAEQFETFCRVDVTYFPFDKQTCKWEMFIWGEDFNHVDLQPLKPDIDISFFAGNGEWELVSTRATRTTILLSGASFPNLVYEVTLKRRPSLLALTILMPVLLLAFVNIFVFSIPSEAGERLSYAVTTLLSFGVFMSFILTSMPSSAETMSIMVVDMSALLILSALYVLLCILSLRLFHRDDDKHPVPGALQSLMVRLEVLLCLEPPSTKVEPIVQVAAPSHHDDQQTADRDVKRFFAEKQLPRKMAFTQPEDMTWRRVSRSLDKLLFRLSFLLVVGSSLVVWVLISLS